MTGIDERVVNKAQALTQAISHGGTVDILIWLFWCAATPHSKTLGEMLVMKELHKLDFYTQYSQFYICDSNSPLKTDSDEIWTDEAHESRLDVEEGILGVGTECYGPVKGELEILNQENTTAETDLFDHIVEGGLEIKSGRLRILDCPNSSIELDIPLTDGIYRVRIYSSNLSSVDGDEGDDFYRIEIWKGTGTIRNIIKKYNPG
jgi:hypothetical protein